MGTQGLGCAGAGEVEHLVGEVDELRIKSVVGRVRLTHKADLTGCQTS